MALTNVREFTLSLDKFADETDERRKDITKIVAMRALKDVVFGTIVDTGRLRGNWQVGEGEPPQGHNPTIYDPAGSGFEGGTPRDAWAEGQVAIGSTTGDDIVWLHNGIPYAEVLERRDKMTAGAYEAALTWLRSQ